MSVKGIVKAAPCPFCGGTTLAMVHSEEDSEYYVGCYSLNCFACGPGAPSEAEALAAWNRRAAKGDDDNGGAPV